MRAELDVLLGSVMTGGRVVGPTRDLALVSCHRDVVRLSANFVGEQLRMGGARERLGSLLTGARERLRSLMTGEGAAA